MEEFKNKGCLIDAPLNRNDGMVKVLMFVKQHQWSDVYPSLAKVR